MKSQFAPVLALAFISNVVPVVAQETAPQTPQFFPDVPRDHWAFAAVQKLAGAGILEGYPAGTAALPAVGAPAVAPLVEIRPEIDSTGLRLVPLVKSALVANPALKGSQINIDFISKGRILALRGAVKTKAQKQLAEAIARKKAPQVRISNQLSLAR
jgi:hypothetical protein